jgi:hypothetical protein
MGSIAEPVLLPFKLLMLLQDFPRNQGHLLTNNDRGKLKTYISPLFHISHLPNGKTITALSAVLTPGGHDAC